MSGADRTAVAVLAGAVLAGGALRLWGIHFGLPNSQGRPDESVLLHRALAIAGGDANPHFFNYPSLHLYLLAAVSGLYYLAGWLMGFLSGPHDLLRLLLLDPGGLYLNGRLLTAAMGTATIAATAVLGHRLGGPAAAAAAAVAVAGASLHVRDSHFMTVDVPAALWSTTALAALTVHAVGGSRSALRVGAVALGLAASTKYNAGLFLPALAVSVWTAPVPNRHLRRLLAVLALAGLAFISTSPWIALDAGAFWRDFTFEWHHFGRGHAAATLGNGWWYHLRFSLRHGLGWPLLSAALASLAWLAACRRRQAGVLLVGVASYYLVAGAGESLFVRYVVPLVPLLCAAAGSGVARVAGGRPLLAASVALLLVAPSLKASVEQDRLLARTDTRVLARRWILGHVPAGDRIALTGSEYGQPQLPPTRMWMAQRLADVRRAGQPGRRLQLALAQPGYPPGPAYDLVQVRAANPLGTASVIEPVDVDQLRRLGVDWIVVQDHPLDYARVPGVLAADLTGLPAAARFDPGPSRALARAVFDPLDAWFVPLSGAGTLLRPGPRLWVYRLGREDSAPGLADSTSGW